MSNRGWPRVVCSFVPPSEGQYNHDPNAVEYRLVHTGSRYELQAERDNEDWREIEPTDAFSLVASLLDPMDSCGYVLWRNGEGRVE